MKERLEAILKHEKISPSRLADIIGVQRSGISHIMSGRNKPGLDFLSKLLDHFPHINGDWLITGQGPMLKNSGNKPMVEQMSFPTTAGTQKDQIMREKPLIKDENPPVYKKAPTSAPLFQQQKGASKDKTIERIIVFYSDKSFTEYKPE